MDKTTAHSAVLVILDTGLGERSAALDLQHTELTEMPTDPASLGYIELPDLAITSYGEKSASHRLTRQSADYSTFPMSRYWLAEIEQRFAFTHFDVFHFGDEDGVIACWLRRAQAAFKIRERALQNRRAVRGALEACTGSFGMLMCF